MKVKEIFKVISLPVVVASLCCLSPLVLVMLGLSSVSAAASLSDTLYGGYKWAFRGIGVLSLVISVIFYLRKNKETCTVDKSKRKHNQVINTILLTLTLGVLGYIFFLYVVVHYAGVFFGIWQ